MCRRSLERFAGNADCWDGGGGLLQYTFIDNEVDINLWVEEAGLSDGIGEIVWYVVAKVDEYKRVGL